MRTCLLIFRETGREGDKEGEKYRLVFLSNAPWLGLNPQLRHVPWLRIKPAVFWFTGQHSNQLSHTGQGKLQIFIEPLLCASHRWFGCDQDSHNICLHGTFNLFYIWLYIKYMLVFNESLLCQCLFPLCKFFPFLYSRILKIILYIYWSLSNVFLKLCTSWRHTLWTHYRTSQISY